MCLWYKCKVYRINILSAANIRKRVNFDSVKGRFLGVGRGGGGGGLNIPVKISGLVKFRIKRNVFSFMLYQLCLLLKI